MMTTAWIKALFRARLDRLAACLLVLAAMIVASPTASAQVVDPIFSASFDETVGTGVGQRPILFQADKARLLASIAANHPEATGSATNNLGQPLGFITLVRAAQANRGSYDDVPTFQLAFGGWLVNQTNANDVAMLNMAKNEALAQVRSRPNGISGTGEAYQHTEEYMLDVAAVADLAYSRFTPSELAEVATWVNGTLTNWMTQNNSFWPFDDPQNNYWQNGFLAMTVGALATQGFNQGIKPGSSPAVTWSQYWLSQAQRMATLYATEATSPKWTGPVQAEGHYYSTYVRNALWAMTLHDNVMGTSWLQQSGTSPAQSLDMLMFELRPHLQHFFLVGSETGSGTNGPFGHTSLSYWHQLISMAPNSEQARHAKSVLAVAMTHQDSFWYRGAKGFQNFYYNIRDVQALPLIGKTGRMYVAPTPGAGLIGARSAAGFGTGARATLMFANHFGWAARWSHANPDAPGFQWADGGDWLVTDPDAFGSSGIIAEGGGFGSDISNIVTIDGVNDNNSLSAGYPVVRFAEDNNGMAVPHFYTQIDAQPYWSTTSVPVSTFRRDYVWLDDLRVVLVYDRVNANAGKGWRLHVPGSPTINGSTVSYTVNGKTVVVRDLYAPGSSAWTSTNLNGWQGINQNVWRVRQNSSVGDYQSLKVLDVGGRVTAASATPGTGSITASLTVNGAVRTVTFYANGNHALVQ